MPLPDVIDYDYYLVLNQIYDYMNNLYYIYGNAPLLGMGSFLRTITDNFKASSASQKIVEPRFRYFSGHDSTIGPMLAALKMLNPPLSPEPPLASHVEFELWRNKQTREVFVSIRYNNQDLIIPSCNKSLCPLSSWLESIKDVVAGNDFAQICEQDKIDELDYEYDEYSTRFLKDFS